MEHNELTAQLRRMSVETGSLICLGCGYEHNCGIHGCALLRQAVETIERQAAALENLGDHECKGNIKLVNAKVSPDGNILADEIIAGCIPNDVIVKLSEYESAQVQRGLVEEVDNRYQRREGRGRAENAGAGENPAGKIS